jgi:hypothetical protein
MAVERNAMGEDIAELLGGVPQATTFLGTSFELDASISSIFDIRLHLRHYLVGFFQICLFYGCLDKEPII